MEDLLTLEILEKPSFADPTGGAQDATQKTRFLPKYYLNLLVCYNWVDFCDDFRYPFDIHTNTLLFSMNELRPDLARRIVETVGANGIPPEYGFQYFTAGLQPYLSVMEEEYLSSFVKQGGSAFKIVVGVYGGGKTHFLYCMRDLAWAHNFVVSYVSLSPEASPFHRLDLVYKAVVGGMMPPPVTDEQLPGYEQGIVSFLRHWYGRMIQELTDKGLSAEDLYDAIEDTVEAIEGIESLSFTKAISGAIRALMANQEEDFINICQWLNCEGYDRGAHSTHGIFQPIDRTTALTMLRSLVQWVRQIGYSGLVILLDEAERVPSLTSRQREQHLSNLREVIDACGHTNFQGAMIFYAVPDENFLEGRTQVYEALRQRVITVFETLNPSGVKIDLQAVVTSPLAFLDEIGGKLASVYQTAYSHEFETEPLEQTIEMAAETAYEQRFGDIGYKRLFVQTLIRGFHFLRQKGVAPKGGDLQMSSESHSDR